MAIIPTSGEFTKVPDGGVVCTDTNGTLDKTMGEILAACSSGIPVMVYDGARYSFPVNVSNVEYDRKEGIYLAFITCLDTIGRVFRYKVSETTEAAALSAYPTHDE